MGRPKKIQKEGDGRWEGGSSFEPVKEAQLSSLLSLVLSPSTLLPTTTSSNIDIHSFVDEAQTLCTRWVYGLEIERHRLG